MKKRLMFVITMVMVFALLAACSSGGSNSEQSASNGSSAEGTGKKMKIALVLPEEIGVNQFFVQMDEGFQKAGKEFGVETKTIQSSDPTAFEQNMRATVAEDYDLIITATFQAEDVLKQVAEENPDKSFAIIDTSVDLPNVRSVGFREYEASYLLGAAAGLATKTNVVGMVAAQDVPLLKKYSEGFKEGLASVNRKAKFLIGYVGSFNDPAKAKELALVQYGQGADFVAGASATSDLGVFEAAKEKNLYTSGQDTDRTVEDPDHVVLSQLKGTDAVAYETVKDFVDGNFKFGSTAYGLKEKGVGLTFVTTDSTSKLSPFIGEDVITKVKKISDDIIAGKIVVKDPLAQK